MYELFLTIIRLFWVKQLDLYTNSIYTNSIYTKSIYHKRALKRIFLESKFIEIKVIEILVHKKCLQVTEKRLGVIFRSERILTFRN